jgi:broad specificity phosphatase PhoE
MFTRICFIRHGETGWNAAKRIQGQSDIPLNETGKGQALAMTFNAAHYNFSVIYSSDLARAYGTAQMVAARRGLEVKELSRIGNSTPLFEVFRVFHSWSIGNSCRRT